MALVSAIYRGPDQTPVAFVEQFWTSRRWEQGAAALLLLLGLYLLLGQLHFFYQFHPHIPIKDTWRLLPLMTTVLEEGWGAASLGDWLEPHAGAHRIALTRVLMALDYSYLGGQNHLLFASAAASLALLLYVYGRAFSSLFLQRRDLVFLCVGLASIWLFSPSQSFNLVNPINASWYTALALGAASLQFLLVGGARRSILYLLLALLAAGLAALSNFAGLLVWLLLPIACLMGGYPRPIVVLIVALMTVVVSAYLAGIESTIGIILNDPEVNRAAMEAWEGKSPALFWLDFIIGVFRNTLVYLGAPLSTLHRVAGMALAALGVLGLAAAWWRWLRYRLRVAHSLPQLLFMLVATLCLGIAMATQLGRIYIGGADALRYQAVVMLYWLSMSGLLVAFLANARDVVRLPGSVVCIALCATLVFLPLGHAGKRESEFINEALVGEQLGMLGIYRSDLYRGVYPAKLEDPQRGAAAFFKKYQLAYAADMSGDGIGSVADSCPPEMKFTLAGKTGYLRHAQLSWSTRSALGNRRVEVRQDGRVTGFVVPQLPAQARASSYLLGREKEWKGYVLTAGPGKNDGLLPGAVMLVVGDFVCAVPSAERGGVLPGG